MNIKKGMKKYDNNGKIKVYLAGPFFSEEQVERVNFIEDLLESLDFDIFSPRQASKIKPGATMQDMLDTFRGNVDGIEEADFVLAILDENDSGTLFECGYSYRKTPVLYFNETREKGPNLMLALSGGLPFITKQTVKATQLLKSSHVYNTKDETIYDDKTPRELLEIMLNEIKNHGVEAIHADTQLPFDEVE